MAQFLTAGARAVPKITLRFPRSFKFFYVSTLITCAICYIIRYMQLQYIAVFGGLQAKLQQMKVVVCCQDGENSHENLVKLFL